MPRVSVILPVYNAGVLLRDSIDSILNQTYTDFELLIIDDGSIDSSGEIVNGYNDSRIRYHVHERNKGIVTALNWGLALAHGEYIARMDADDVAVPHRFQHQVEFMDSRIDVGVAGSWVTYFGEREGLMRMPVSHEEILWVMLFGSPFFHPTVMIRAEVLRKNHLTYPEGYPHGEDYALWSKLSNVTTFANMPETLLKYRVSGNSVSSRFSERQRETRSRISRDVHEHLAGRSLADDEWENVRIDSPCVMNPRQAEIVYLEMLPRTFKDEENFRKRLAIRLKQLLRARSMPMNALPWLIAHAAKDPAFLKFLVLPKVRTKY